MWSSSAQVFIVNRKNRRFENNLNGSSNENTKRSLLSLLRKKNAKWILKSSAFILYNIYLCFAIAINWQQYKQGKSIQVLVAITLAIYTYIIYYIGARDFIFRPLVRKCSGLILKIGEKWWIFQVLKKFLWMIIILSIGLALIIDCFEDYLRLRSFLGLVVIVGFGYTFSFKRGMVVWRPIFGGILVQYLIAYVFLRWSETSAVLRGSEKMILGFLEDTHAGTDFVYGYLSSGKLKEVNSTLQLGIFAYQPEVCLSILPYLSEMSTSEYHALMTSGFATVAMRLFSSYVELGIHSSHLLVASAMSAPASLAFSKLFYPETKRTKTVHWQIGSHKSDCQSVLEAAVEGASCGMKTTLMVMGNLIGFISFITALNYIPGWFGGLVEYPYLSLKWLYSRLLVPVPFLFGVELKDCSNVAWLVGLNISFANLAAFKNLAEMKRSRLLSRRSEALATFGICGFSNLSYVGVVFSSLASLAPNRKKDIAGLVMRAFISGTCASFMTACIAGSVIIQFPKDVQVSNFTRQTEESDWTM